MHELSLAQALLDLAQKNANGRRILSLKVRVGALSGVVTDSLAFAFEMISRGTSAEDARLEFEHVPVRMICKQCGQAVATGEWDDLPGNEVVYRALERGCACGGQELSIAGGQEFQLVEIEVRDSETVP
jgi:hydrogenase nickel incorporation protein HypA/HybF